MACIKGWLLTVVLICTIPPIVILGAITTILLGKLESQAQTAYSVAASIVEQTISSIRAICELKHISFLVFTLWNLQRLCWSRLLHFQERSGQ